MEVILKTKSAMGKQTVYPKPFAEKLIKMGLAVEVEKKKPATKKKAK